MTLESKTVQHQVSMAGVGSMLAFSEHGINAVARISGLVPHIAVCICTYKRPELLKSLLEKLAGQQTDGLFTHSMVVVDNDHAESARAVVLEFIAGSSMAVSYHVEPRQNIALARNKAVQNANGDYVAFIDDDEVPTDRWLATLLCACEKYQADGVLGPVKPRFDKDAPKWIIRGGFYNRSTYPTGCVIDGAKGRTGNVLLRKAVFLAAAQPFRPEFRTGEDQDFFRRMIEAKQVFVWCDEAVAYEAVPATRCKRSFLLRRALLRGQTAVLHPGFGAHEITKSMVAVPVYTVALPFALLLGQHRFMSVLVRLTDHLGKLMALAGINPVSQEYITE
jgi:glycosyltransferase involved in cell wall biosynthesis